MTKNLGNITYTYKSTLCEVYIVRWVELQDTIFLFDISEKANRIPYNITRRVKCQHNETKYQLELQTKNRFSDFSLHFYLKYFLGIFFQQYHSTTSHKPQNDKQFLRQ